MLVTTIILHIFFVVFSSANVLMRRFPCDPACDGLIVTCGATGGVCPCTTAIQQEAQSCFDCVTTKEAGIDAITGFDPVALAQGFNDHCAGTGIHVNFDGSGIGSGSSSSDDPGSSTGSSSSNNGGDGDASKSSTAPLGQKSEARMQNRWNFATCVLFGLSTPIIVMFLHL